MPLKEKILQEAHDYLDKGDVDLAQWIFDKLLGDHPNYACAHHERAILAHRMGDAVKAGGHFLRAVELAPNDPVYLKSLGDFYHVAEGKTDAALVQYERVLDVVPGDKDTLLTAAHLCVGLQRFDKARDYYQRILSIAPDHVEARSILARLNSRSAKPESQISIESISRESISPESLYEEACRQSGDGVRQEAVATLEQVVNLDPGHAQAHNDLGVLCYESGDKQRAFEHYEKAVALMPANATFQKNLADFLWKEKNDGKGALKGYIEVLRTDSRDIEALLGCGRICIASGKPEDARDFIDCALSVEPWNQDGHDLLDQLENGKSGADETFDPNALYQSAQFKRTAKDYMGAIEDLNILLRHEPEFAAAYNDLGVIYYETGDKSKALQSYEKSIELDPGQPNVLKNLADFYLVEQERIEDAMRFYLKALEINSEDIECLLASGFICALLGKNEDAAVFYKRVIAIEPSNNLAVDALAKLEASKNPDNELAGRACG